MNLFLFLSVPGGAMVLLGLPSLAIGIIIFFACYMVFHFRNIIERFTLPKSYLYFLIIIALSISLQVIPPYNISFIGKSIFSFLTLFVVFIGSAFFINNFLKMLDSDNRFLIQQAYWIFLLVGFLGLMKLQPNFVALFTTKLVYPFFEPSHFTIAFSIVSTAMICVTKPRYRIPILLVTLTFASLFPSTLCLVIFFLQVMLLTKNFKSTIGVAAVLLIISPLVLIFLDIDYYLSRVFSSNETINLTNMVYLQGWESINSSLKESYGFGLGFQMMGQKYSGPMAQLLCETHSMCINNLDGSFLAAKLITEFGVLGIIISCLFLYMAYKSFVLIRIHLSFIDRGVSIFKNSDVFGFCVLYVFTAELFLRGYGYFSPTFLLALYFLFFPLNHKLNELKFQ